MAIPLNIGQATALDDLAKWHRAKGHQVKFSVSKTSSFALAVEGVALGVLRELQTASSIDLECTFDILAEDQTKGQDAKLGLFDGLFGLALIVAARSIRVHSSTASRAEILDCLWRRVRIGRGAVGDGKRMSLVSRDPDDPVPECLRAGIAGFPKRDRFSAVLLERSRNLGVAKGGYSKSEDDAITFIFEAARNSFEHARNDANGAGVRGIRGILVEKLVFGSHAEARTRQGLSELQRLYLQRVWGNLGAQRRVLAYTVADLGPGIQRTLRPAPGETPWARLTRAFEPGETRKPRGTDVEGGLGLPRLCSAAARLKALLLVKSGDLTAVADFSLPVLEKRVPLERLRSASDLGDLGTSLTLLWVETAGAGDQEQLF